MTEVLVETKPWMKDSSGQSWVLIDGVLKPAVFWHWYGRDGRYLGESVGTHASLTLGPLVTFPCVRPPPVV